MQPASKFARQCEDRLPGEICHALNKTSSIHAQIQMQHQEVCVPGFCAKYSAKVSCAILKKLIQVGEANKAQPQASA
ncbi:unnamed protein product [Anisakis simplex]|uniref:Uncharacterized protein n=1 Tax=Anisakis simplex TaxID=6269 RepID=A0A0M3JI64_ANISI|nr:unnamed protein product [Anisakis simplex]